MGLICHLSGFEFEPLFFEFAGSHGGHFGVELLSQFEGHHLAHSMPLVLLGSVSARVRVSARSLVEYGPTAPIGVSLSPGLWASVCSIVGLSVSVDGSVW